MPEANYTQHWFYPQIWVCNDEEWRDVRDHEGLYQVSNLGNVRSLDRWIVKHYQKTGDRKCLIKGKPTKGTVAGAGFRAVGLWKNNVNYSWYVHRLVLDTFVGPCPEGMEACHFPDRDITNNRLFNLRWDTHVNNCKDREIHGTNLKGRPGKIFGVRHPGAKMTDDGVRSMRYLYHSGRKNQVDLAAMFDIDQTVVSEIVRYKSWKHVLD